MPSDPSAKHRPGLLCPDWLRWLIYPGPRRVFTPDEMARAGSQPWPAGIDHYVYGNVVMLLAVLLSSAPRTTFRSLLWPAVLVTTWLVLAVAHRLWRSPTRKQLNLACYGAGLVVALVGLAAMRQGWRAEVLDSTPLVLAVLTSVLSGWWVVTLYRVAQIEARLRELAEQDAALRLSTRLAAAQIQPHFLFNTLASLQHWVDTGDARAAPLLRDFTAYLRATLPMFERELQPLADELEMVRRYLAIMQARLGPRLSFHIDAPAGVPIELPPGLLLTLAENAITHGIEPQLGGGRVEVRLARSPGRIELRVQDDGRGLPPHWTEGVGLANTRRRLLQAFPGATLTLADAAPGCIATLNLPA